MRVRSPDRFFFILVIVLAAAGFVVFSSAALGVISRDGAGFTVVVGKQLFILLIGVAAFLVVSSIPYHRWEKWAPHLFVASLFLTLLVFIPGLGLKAGGAKRWLIIPLGGASFSFQPAEFLKLGFILAWAWWLAKYQARIKDFKYSILPFVGVITVIGAILVNQPNNSTLVLITAAGVTMLLVAGPRLSHLLVLAVVGISVLSLVLATQSHVLDRLATYANPDRDPTDDSYQLNQSLIAIGSGGIFGRGFGQSTQKFGYLPEPMGDSIFAVAAEEFGLIGSTTLIIMLLLFGLWGLKITARAPDLFSRLLALGIVILISVQVIVNVGSMIGLLPLTGVPLPFVSQGGTSLLLTLVAAGLVLNISRYRLPS